MASDYTLFEVVITAIIQREDKKYLVTRRSPTKKRFPGNIIAGMFNFEPREYFELGEGEEAARQPVKVSF